MRIVVAGGGTAGHISPILAAVAELKRRDKQLSVLYVGQRSGMEADMAVGAGIKFKGIQAGKYRRVPHASIWEKLSNPKTVALNTRDLGRSVTGVTQSLSILRRFKPDVVFCKGGFVALPVGIAARILKIPLVIHESDVSPGLGTKILGRWADHIAVGFPPELYSTLPKSRVVFTGNPVRSEIVDSKVDKEQAAKHFFGQSDGRPVVLVVGGSQGATTINEAVLDALPELIKTARVIHVAGSYDFKRVESQAQELGIGSSDYICKEFIDAGEMAKAYAAADVVISRAGANTITELAALSKAVILIPNSLMAAHQLENGRRLATLGAVELLPESRLNQSNLLSSVNNLLSSKELRDELGAELHKVYVPDSTSRLVDIIQAASEVRA